MICKGCGGEGRIELEKALSGLSVVENRFEVEEPGLELETALKPYRELKQEDLIAALHCQNPGRERTTVEWLKGIAISEDSVRLMGESTEYSIYRVNPERYVLMRWSQMGARDAGRWFTTEKYGRIAEEQGREG